MQTINITEGDNRMYNYKDETGHISNFLVRNLIIHIVLQWGNKGGEEEGEVGYNYMCIFGLLPVSE